MKPPAPLMRIASLSAMALALVGLAPSAAQAAGQQAAAPPVGETLFKQRCAMCHAAAGRGGQVGPDLTGVVGRKAASTDFAYSPALKAAKIQWTPGTLDGFLSAPTKMVPGSRMVISVSKVEDRRAIIAYLASLKK